MSEKHTSANRAYLASHASSKSCFTGLQIRSERYMTLRPEALKMRKGLIN